MPSMSILDRVIGQMDTLIPFLSLSHEEVFELVNTHHSSWFTQEQEAHLPETLDAHQRQVAQAALVLGISYVEAFLVDLAHAVYRRRPQMLPGNKEVRFSELLDLNHFDNVIELMIEKEVGAVFHGSMDKIGKHFRDKLTLDWLEDDRIVKASLIRNCIVHNNGVADRRLAEASTLDVGDAIRLSDGDVHDFGLVGRQLCRQLYADAEEKFLSTGGTT